MSRYSKTTSIQSHTRRAGRTKAKARKNDPRDYYDYNLLASVILLTCFGLVMLYSTSAYEAFVEYESDMYFFGKQAIIGAASILIILVGSQFDYHFYAKFSGLLYVASLALLVITKFMGRTVNGATRWLYIGPISFQPAELAKLAIILFLPVIMCRIDESRLRGTRAFLMMFGIGGVSALLTYRFTDNLSTAIIIIGITAALVFIVFQDTRQILTIYVSGLILVLFFAVVILPRVMASSDSFRLRRILVWLDPEKYANDGGYQVMQGLYAIGSGGWFGKGLGNSTQKLGILPEAQNDMIFSIVCEELGVFGATIVVLLFVFLLYRLFFIAQNAPDLLGSLIASGIFVHIALQVVLNIAVCINMIPTTGITLPFVSYGGTSILFLMAEITLALSISKKIEFH